MAFLWMSRGSPEEHEAHHACVHVILAHLLQHRLEGAAGGTLVVSELTHHHGRIRLS